MKHAIMNLLEIIFQLYYSFDSLYGIIFDLLFMFFLLCRRGNNHFDVHFQRIGPYFFLSKNGKIAVREAKNGRKGDNFPPESESFSFW